MTKIVRTSISVLLAAVLGLGVVYSVSKDVNWKIHSTQEAVTVSTPVTRVVKDVEKSVYGILNTATEGVSSGSGFVYKIDGDRAYLLTNAHVVDGADKLELFFEKGSTIEAKAEGIDKNFDLAVVSVNKKDLPNGAKALPISNDEPKQGDEVIAMGSPYGPEYYNTTTTGIVSNTSRIFVERTKRSKGLFYNDFLQIDAAINHGNSGGPLFNQKGEVIGINARGIAGHIEDRVSNLAFSIPGYVIKEVLQHIESGGYKQIAELGLLIDGIYNRENEPIVEKGSGAGNYVLAIMRNTAAERAGFQKGDLIVEVDGNNGNSTTAIAKKLLKTNKGDKFQVKVSRNGNIQTLDVTIDTMLD